MSSYQGRVMHFIDSGGLYGAENVLLNLSREMVTTGRYEPVVGCVVASPEQSSDLYDRARELGLEARKVVIRNWLLAVDLPRAARQMRAWGIDLIHSHGYKPSVFGYALRSMAPLEVMATCHNWVHGSRNSPKRRMMVALELFFYRRFPVVIGVSDPVRQVLLDSGVAPQRALVIKNGVQVGKDLESAATDLEALRRELDLEAGRAVVLTTGRLTRLKAQADIVEAARLLKAQGPIPYFLLIGEGELKEDLRRQIAEAGLEGDVRLVGFRSDIPRLLELADLFLLPSLDEGMPMSMLEAGAMGVPVVATAVGDIPKVIRDGVSGRLVPAGQPARLAEVIGQLMAREDQRRELGMAIRQVVMQEYSTAAMHRQYCAVYDDLLAS